MWKLWHSNDFEMRYQLEAEVLVQKAASLSCPLKSFGSNSNNAFDTDWPQKAVRNPDSLIVKLNQIGVQVMRQISAGNWRSPMSIGSGQLGHWSGIQMTMWFDKWADHHRD